MKPPMRYRGILHGPVFWKGATRAADADRQPPFIVAFEPQNHLLVVKQGTVELDDLTIEDETCESQILSVFFFDTYDQALEAKQVLAKSLDRLQTIYDIFMSTRVLEILEQVLGCTYIPLEIVARRMDFTADKRDDTQRKAASPVSETAEPYSIRIAAVQGLMPVTPGVDFIQYIRDAVVKKGSDVNRVSVTFYISKTVSAVQTPAAVCTPYLMGMSGRSTPINVTRGNTPSARLGKAVMDLYIKRGVIGQSGSMPQQPCRSSIIDASPVLKALLSSKEMEEELNNSIEGLRTVSQDVYVSSRVKPSEEVFPVDADIQGVIISELNENIDAEEANGFVFAEYVPPSSERTNISAVEMAVDEALNFFEKWDHEKSDMFASPEPVNRTLELQGVNDFVSGECNELQEPEGEHVESPKDGSENMNEVSPLMLEMEEEQRREYNVAVTPPRMGTAMLNIVLGEKECIVPEVPPPMSVEECDVLTEVTPEVKELNKQLDAVVLEKEELHKEVLSLREERETMLQKVKAANLKIAEMHNREEVLHEIKMDYEDKLKVMDACITHLQQQNNQLVSDIEEQRRQQELLELAARDHTDVTQKENEDICKICDGGGLLAEKDDELRIAGERIKGLEAEVSESKRKEKKLSIQHKEVQDLNLELKQQLEVVIELNDKLKDELDSERGRRSQLEERFTSLEFAKTKLEQKLNDLRSREEILEIDKSDAVDKYLKEKSRCDSLVKEYEHKISIFCGQVKALNVQHDKMEMKYATLQEEYASQKLKACLGKGKLMRKITSSNHLNGRLIDTVLKSKAELARIRCQIRTVANALQLPDNATTRHIISKLKKPKSLDPEVEQKINDYEKLKVSYTKLKSKISEQEKLLELRNSSYRKSVERQESLQEENKRLVMALSQERNKCITLESVTKKQVRDELTKANEEKRMLYAKQCELTMQNEGLKKKIDALNQQLTMLRMESIDIEGRDKSAFVPKYGSIDANNLVMEKLNKMRTVFDKGDRTDLPFGMASQTTFDDGLSMDSGRNSNIRKQKTADRIIIPSSPCAYKDTKASLYSRRATLEKLRTRQIKSEDRFEGIYGSATMKQKQPWVF